VPNCHCLDASLVNAIVLSNTGASVGNTLVHFSLSSAKSSPAALRLGSDSQFTQCLALLFGSPNSQQCGAGSNIGVLLESSGSGLGSVFRLLATGPSPKAFSSQRCSHYFIISTDIQISGVLDLKTIEPSSSQHTGKAAAETVKLSILNFYCCRLKPTNLLHYCE